MHDLEPQQYVPLFPFHWLPEFWNLSRRASVLRLECGWMV
jgi:hypothetical protein